MKWVLRFTENHLHRSAPAVSFTPSDGAQTGSNLDLTPLGSDHTKRLKISQVTSGFAGPAVTLTELSLKSIKHPTGAAEETRTYCLSIRGSVDLGFFPKY